MIKYWKEKWNQCYSPLSEKDGSGYFCLYYHANQWSLSAYFKTVIIYIDWQDFFAFPITLYVNKFLFCMWLLFMRLITFLFRVTWDEKSNNFSRTSLTLGRACVYRYRIGRLLSNWRFMLFTVTSYDGSLSVLHREFPNKCLQFSFSSKIHYLLLKAILLAPSW